MGHPPPTHCLFWFVVACVFNVLSDLGNSSSDVTERTSSDQPSSPSSNADNQQAWLCRTQPSLASYFPARQTGDTPREEDHPGSWTYRCRSLHVDNQIHRRWSELQRVWSPPLSGSDVVCKLHRPKPLRFRPYSTIPTTNWQCLSNGYQL